MYPGAVELWYDGIEGDCAGGSDLDQDGDGYDSDAHGGDDCDDLDAGRYPGSGTWAVPGDAATIQEAVELACTLDEIVVAAGTYAENVDFGYKALDLVGAGLDVTTISGVDYAPVVTMAGGTLDGFTIRGGSSRVDGGGVRIDGATSAALSDLYIVENYTSGDGGGVAVTDSGEVTIRDCQVVGNEAGGDGGGISANALSGSGDLTWVGGSVAGNAGAGTAVAFTGVAVLSGLEVSQNSGGLTIDGDLVADDLRVWGTSGASSSVLGITGFAELTDVTLLGNAAPSMLVVDGGFDLTRVEVTDSDVDTDGVAVELSGSGTAQHVLIAGVEDGTGLDLVAADAADFQEIDHLTVVGCEQYGIRLSGVTDYQFALVHVLVEDSGYTGFLGIGYRIALTWAALGGEYSSLDLSAADWATVPSDTPEFVSYHADLPSWSWDLHLLPGSALVDVDATETDADGTPADIGAYGGAAADPDWYADADADGMPDGWEIEHGLDPATDDSGGDDDGDGVTNGDELAAGTDPGDANTDDDHADDGESEPLSADLDEDAEYQSGSAETSLLSFCSLPDIDRDGSDELAYNLYNSYTGYTYETLVDPISGSNGSIRTGREFDCTRISGDFDDDGDDDIAIQDFPYLLVVTGPFPDDDSVWVDNSVNSSYVTAGYTGLADDFDADGIDDLVVASQSYSGTYSYGGAIFFYTDVGTFLDAHSSIQETDATLTLEGSADNEWFGSTVVSGDGDGDGDPDLAVTDSYATYVFTGPLTSTGTLTSADADVTTATDPARYTDYTSNVSVGGDLDGDGIDELVFRHSYGSAGLYVLSNPADGAVLSDAIQVISDASRGTLEGPIEPGDLDGDGLGDLFVGASAGDSDDTILVFLGSSTLASERTADDADHALIDGGEGTGFAADFQVGDFDGDGQSDIAAEIGVSSGYPGVEFFFGSAF